MFRKVGAFTDVERGRHGSHLHTSLLARLVRRYGIFAILLVTFMFMFFVSRLLKTVFKSHAGDVGDDATETGDSQSQMSCSQRLAAAGLDLDGPGRALLSDRVFERQSIYSKMDGNIDIKGLSLGGVITQGLKQADLFHFDSISASHVDIHPVLRPLDIPVRAMILPLLESRANRRIKAAVDAVLLPVLPKGSIWLQDYRMFHATLYHASSHVVPVPATAQEVQQEAQAIRQVTRGTCPIKGVLDRIIITNSGVIVACWQVLPTGAEPADLRRALGQALPKSPSVEGQMVKEPAMLHTTLARLLQPPAELHTEVDAAAVSAAVQDLSNTLCGLTATFDEVWFVEEQDLLALALEGRFVKHPAPLVCPPAA